MRDGCVVNSVQIDLLAKPAANPPLAIVASICVTPRVLEQMQIIRFDMVMMKAGILPRACAASAASTEPRSFMIGSIGKVCPLVFKAMGRRPNAGNFGV
jgi:hypothetical protein